MAKLALLAVLLFANDATATILSEHTYTWRSHLVEGEVVVTAQVIDNFQGNIGRYEWRYTVLNVSYNPDFSNFHPPRPSNGVASFSVPIPPELPEASDLYGPPGWVKSFGCCNSNNARIATWRTVSPDGIGIGRTAVFGFSTFPRQIVTEGSGAAAFSGGIPEPSGATTYYFGIGGLIDHPRGLVSDTMTLVAAMLPGSRAVQRSRVATAFATVIASGSGTATGCTIAPTRFPGGISFSYQQTNAQNEPVGQPNTPATIPGGSAQSFIISLIPLTAFPATDIEFAFDCANAEPAAVLAGVNTLLLTSTSDRGPDVVALAATLTNDGITDIPGVAGTGVFSVATVNVGAGAAITATVDTGSATLPVVLTLCQTNPGTAACINPATPGSSATVQIEAGQTPTFAVFVRPPGAWPSTRALTGPS